MFLIIALKKFQECHRVSVFWTFWLGTQVWNMFWFLYFEIIFIGTLEGILFDFLLCNKLNMYYLLMNFQS
jgi:hypothetical protein